MALLPFDPDYVAPNTASNTSQAPVQTPVASPELLPFDPDYVAPQAQAPAPVAPQAPVNNDFQYSFNPSSAGTSAEGAPAIPVTLTDMKIATPKLPVTGPYDSSNPMLPSAWSDEVKPSTFEGFDEHGFSDIAPPAHLATALIDSVPEKLQYLQTHYGTDPSTNQPNWFGTDEAGHIIYSQDQGKSWNSFEAPIASKSFWENLNASVPKAGVGLGTVALTAGGGTAGTLANPGYGSYVGAAAGSMAADVAKRTLAREMGFSDQPIINGPALEKAAVVGAVSQGVGNVLNNVGGRELEDVLTAPSTTPVNREVLVKMFNNPAVSAENKALLLEQINKLPAESIPKQLGLPDVGMSDLKGAPLPQSGFGPLTTQSGPALSSTINALNKVGKVGGAIGGGLGGAALGNEWGPLSSLYMGATGLLGGPALVEKLGALPIKGTASVLTSPVYNPGSYVGQAALGGLDSYTNALKTRLSPSQQKLIQAYQSLNQK